MSRAPFEYARDDWFGPESFVTVVLGMICLTLPLTGLGPRDIAWALAALPIVGGALIALGATGLPFSGNLRRAGVGFVAALAGFLLSVLGLLLGISLGGLFA